nr:hypothetical protein [Candidatus Sigynarchaeum springense]
MAEASKYPSRLVSSIGIQSPPIFSIKAISNAPNAPHRTFWRSVLLEALDGDGVARGIEPVTARAQAREDFADLYDGTGAARP